jgi:hypothetical protein
MNESKDVPLTVHREGEPPPADLPSLPQLFAEARVRNLGLTLVSHPLGLDTRKVLAKRRHDVKAALRTFSFTLKAIESGYKFDDDKAQAKIDAIAKALAVLQKECDILCGVLHEE